ncbi:MAG TPA: hypothetical protein VKA67_06735 [Verrucomicrobiae bacterium]|nr:hypothetical protein [Verrucomicrobiae bacterium]
MADQLNGNPFKWQGKKVRNRKNGEVYTVREVMKSGRVVMEKRSVLFTADVPRLREDFEADSP